MACVFKCKSFFPDIADASKKVLVNGFVESVKSLVKTAGMTEEDKLKEFVRNVFNIKFCSNVGAFFLPDFFKHVQKCPHLSKVIA